MHTAPFSGSVVTMEGSDQERPGNRARSSQNRYRECRRNHAACLGRYAFDGCGEFLKSGGDDKNKAILCAACGCHRSFHRKEWSGGGDEVVNAAAESSETGSEGDGGGRGRKRRKRTLLSDDKKRKMRGFAEKLGWKLQRRDEEEIHQFCSEILGIKTRVFRVWLNNNRHNKGPGDGAGDIGDGAGDGDGDGAGDIGDGGAVTVLLKQAEPLSV